MSNLVKQVYVVNNGDDRWLINSNAQAEAILKKQLKPNQVIREGDEMPQGDALELQGKAQMEEITPPSPEEILAEAQAKAEAIVSEANARAETIRQELETERNQTLETAKMQGYQEGLAQAEQEKEETLQTLKNEYEGKKLDLEQEYQQNYQNMEVELVETILPVFQKVFQVDLEKDKSILLHLCKNALMGMEADKQFHIKVGAEIKEYFMTHQEELLGNLPNDVTVDFLTDQTLSENGCIIETESGIVDCGADTQIENLMSAIYKLSRN